MSKVYDIVESSELTIVHKQTLSSLRQSGDAKSLYTCAKLLDALL